MSCRFRAQPLHICTVVHVMELSVSLFAAWPAGFRMSASGVSSGALTSLQPWGRPMFASDRQAAPVRRACCGALHRPAALRRGNRRVYPGCDLRQPPLACAIRTAVAAVKCHPHRPKGRDSVSRRLPSGSKLYTLRGVPTVCITVTSIRNCRRTLPWRYPSGRGNRSRMPRRAHTLSNDQHMVAPWFSRVDGDPASTYLSSTAWHTHHRQTDPFLQDAAWFS